MLQILMNAQISHKSVLKKYLLMHVHEEEINAESTVQRTRRENKVELEELDGYGENVSAVCCFVEAKFSN